MPARYRVDLRDPSGAKVAEFSDMLGLSFERRVNAPGAVALTVSGEDQAAALFEANGQIEVWRRVPELGIDWYREAAYLVEDEEDAMPQRTRVHTASGRGYLSLCDRRIVAAFAGSAQAAKAGPADDVMKAIVREQLGPAATAGRVVAGLSVQADSGEGQAVVKAFSYRNVLEVLQDLSAAGVDFDIVGTGPGKYEFRTYPGQLGADRRETVLFALNYDNMAGPRWQVRRAALRNAVLVAGQGEGELRETVWCEEAGLDGWTRREAFVDARDQESAAALEARGSAALARTKTLAQLTFQVQQTSALAYGRDYGLGDLVRVRYGSHQVDKKIVGVKIEVSRQRGESITPELADV